MVASHLGVADGNALCVAWSAEAMGDTALSLGGFGAVLGLLGCIFVPDTANKITTAQE
jgi:hypothetical protein